MKIIKPEDTEKDFLKIAKKIFLAGSITDADDWQNKISEFLKPYNVVLFNPRRDIWDSAWIQDQSNEQFNNQVNWEIQKLEECDIIFMYFDIKTKSPITLLELGYYLKSNKLIVCCPHGFWRKGNVDIMCVKNNVPLFDSIDAAMGGLITKIKS
jgi:hypothetical protein